MSARYRQDLWKRIGMVPQKAFLFSGTVAGNLRYGDEEATDDELWQALEIAQGARLRRPRCAEQLEAPIDQGGTNVSGGQRQRLAIARALVKRPEIYIFDDSFSALDFRTDARLRAALREELGDATVIIVAQRVGTILHADRIVVLDDGRIVGIGTHDELMDELRDVPGDRLVPGHRGGGRMSGSTGPAAAARARAAARTRRTRHAGPRARRRPARHAHGHDDACREGARLPRLLPPAARRAPAGERRGSSLVLLLAIVSVALRDRRAQDPRQRHQHHLRGRGSVGKQFPQTAA